jgi:hypothetical protein
MIPLVIPNTIPYPSDEKSCQLIFKAAVPTNIASAAILKYRLLTVMRVCVSNIACPEGGIEEPKNRALAIETTARSSSTPSIRNLLYSCVRKNIQKMARMNNGPLYMSEKSAVDDRSILLISPYCTRLAEA